MVKSNDSKKEKKRVTKKDSIVKEEPVIEKNISPDFFKNKLRHSVHFSFNARLIINIIIVFILFLSFVYIVSKSFSVTKKEIVTYRETGDIDYKVYLKDNDFYDEPYLGKGMAYVASLIDKIEIKYNYLFNTSVESNIDINYKMVGRLTIASQSNSNVFFEKEYDLTKTIIDEMVNKKNYIIDKSVVIDYHYYNDLANQFRANYSVNTTSRLDVFLKIEESSKESNDYELFNQSSTMLSIPLSEQEVSINLNGININNENKVVKDSKFVVNDIGYVLVGTFLLVSLLISVSLLLEMILLITKKKKSAYDKFINRILVGYDRIIVNIKTVPNMDNYNVIKVENFDELVDVRDNTKEPINYLVIAEHQKSEFFVINGNNLYLYIVKAVDFEEEKKNEQSY